MSELKFEDVAYDRKITWKRCGKFMPSPEDPDTCLGCRYSKDYHTMLDVKSWTREATHWSPVTCLVTQDQEIRGQINLINEIENVEKCADFAVVADDTNPEFIIKKVLTSEEVFGLELPEFIVSIVGSMWKVNVAEERQRMRLKEGFRNAVTSTSSWVLTGGSNYGIDGYISELVKEDIYLQWIGTREKVCQLIGICNWNLIDQHESIARSFVSEDGGESSDERVYKYWCKPLSSVPRHSTDYKIPLNPLHDKLLMVDGGVKGKLRTEERLRSEVEIELAKLRPLVMVVIGGGVDVFKRVYEAVKNGIPVVVCGGSGDAADIIFYALRITANSYSKINPISAYQMKKINSMIEKELLPPKSEKQLKSTESVKESTSIKYLQKICRHRSLIVDCNIQNTDCNLDAEVLKAIYNSCGNIDKLNLALSWDHCDDNVHQMLDSHGSILEIGNIDQLMTDAILEQKLEFVSIFVEYGLSMDKFLTPQKLEFLYQHTMDNHPPFAYLIRKIRGKKSHYSLEDVYELIKHFTSALPKMEVVHLVPPSANRESELGSNEWFVDSLAELNEGISGKAQTIAFKDPYRELAIWAVFSNREASCKYYWQRSDCQIILCLLISELWRVHSTALSMEEKDLEEEMEENETEFNEYALELLTECWNEEKDLCQDLLALKEESFALKTPIDIAGYCEAKAFMATPSVQAVIESQWKNGIKGEFGDIIAALFFPFFIRDLQVDVLGAEQDPNVVQEAEFVPKSVRLTRLEADMFDKPESSKTASRSFDLNQMNEDNLTGPQSQQQLPKKKKDFGDFKAKAIRLHSAPCVKFMTHSFAYIIFLLSFSKFYLHLEPVGHTLQEYVQFTFMMCYMIETLRQLITDDAAWSMKMALWAKSEWNIVDSIYLSCGILGFILNFVPALYDIVQLCYCVAVFLMWLRLLRFYQCSERLGPIWIMIRKMLVETIIFSSIFVVMVIATGLALVSMSISEIGDGDFTTYQWLFLRPYFMFHGELFLDVVAEGINVRMTNFFLVIFLFIGNALLLNLLVAVYGSVYNEIEANSSTEWKNELFWLVVEYQKKTYIPPPFGIVESIIRLIVYFRQRRKAKKLIKVSEKEDIKPEDKPKGKKTKSVQSIRDKLRRFEGYCTNETMARKQLVMTKEQCVEKLLKVEEDQTNQIKECSVLVSACRVTIEQRRAERMELKRKRLREAAASASAANTLQKGQQGNKQGESHA